MRSSLKKINKQNIERNEEENTKEIERKQISQREKTKSNEPP